MEYVEYKYKEVLYIRRIIKSEIIWKRWDNKKELNPDFIIELEKDYSIPKNKRCYYCKQDYSYICEFCGVKKICKDHTNSRGRCNSCQRMIDGYV